MDVLNRIACFCFLHDLQLLVQTLGASLGAGVFDHDWSRQREFS